MAEEADTSGHRIPQLNATSFALVSDHQLIRLIGKGSYGEVWLAKNTLGTYRAVKIVCESGFRHRRPFEREYNGVQNFEPVSRLHEGLMDVLQVGRDDAAGYFYCVMELADDVHTGQAIDPDHYQPRTLAHEIATRKRLPIAECRQIGTAIAGALGFLHQRGLIHRDVKPANIIFVNGLPKLADIGLVAEAADARSYVGTEGFIPPEGPGTVQADIFSFGKVLYEISTGKDRHDYPELPDQLGDSIREDELFEFNRVVMRACRADPRQRYRSAKALADDLIPGHLDRRQPMRRRLLNAKTLAGSGVLLCGLIVGPLFFTNHKTGNRVIVPPSPSAVPARRGPLPPASGLVSYWMAENDAVDSVGLNDGQAENGLSYAPGQVGQAFLFNTPNAMVKLEAGAGLDVGAGDGFTLLAWINPNHVTNRGTIFEWNNGEGMWGVHFYVDPFCRPNEYVPGALYANLPDAEMNWHRISSPTGVVAPNTFQHVALSYDKVAGEAAIYCNGVVVTQRTLGQFTSLTTFDLYLGRRTSSEVANELFCFEGLIDEPAVYNRALAPREVQEIYEAGRNGRSFIAPCSVTRPPGLVAWWRAETNDWDSGGANHGKVASAVSYAAGKVGQAFCFTGNTNSYIEVPDSPALRLTNELTIEFWAKRQKPYTSDFIVSKGGDWSRGQVNYGVCIANARMKNRLTFCFPGGSCGFSTVPDLRWHHYAVAVRNGDADAVCYLDGVQQPLSYHDGPPTISLYPSTEPLYIGAQVDPVSGWSYYGRSLIDELSIYSRMLSDSEIEAIYRAGRAGKSVSQTTTADR